MKVGLVQQLLRSRACDRAGVAFTRDDGHHGRMQIRRMIRGWVAATVMVAVAALLTMGAAAPSHAVAVEFAKATHGTAHACCHEPTPAGQVMPCPHVLVQLGGPLPSVPDLLRSPALPVRWSLDEARLLGRPLRPLTPPPRPAHA